MSSAKDGPVRADQLRIVPANEASWEDVCAVFGAADPARCCCQRFKVVGWLWSETTEDERRESLQSQTNCGKARARSTSGLVAYLGDEAVGWVAVEPRTAYPRLERLRMVWKDRPAEDKADDDVWSVTCFVVRKGFRKRGITYSLAAAAVDWAMANGARAIEGYAMDTPPGKDITWGEMHVGSRSVFEAAGFEEVTHPSLRRAIMRIDFTRPDTGGITSLAGGRYG